MGKPALHRQQVAAVPGFCCAPLPWKAFQAFPLRLIDSYNPSFTEQSEAVSQARQKKEQRREKENVCQIHSPYCKLPSRPPWTSPLGWRCLEDRDDESLREVAKEIKETQEWNDVKGEVTGLEDA